jgi:hypothetical protein
MMENISMTESMVMVSTLGRTADNILANGKMENNMEKVPIDRQLE